MWLLIRDVIWSLVAMASLVTASYFLFGCSAMQKESETAKDMWSGVACEVVASELVREACDRVGAEGSLSVDTCTKACVGMSEMYLKDKETSAPSNTVASLCEAACEDAQSLKCRDVYGFRDRIAEGCVTILNDLND